MVQSCSGGGCSEVGCRDVACRGAATKRTDGQGGIGGKAHVEVGDERKVYSDDPTGSEGEWPPITDEIGRCRKHLTTTLRTAANSKSRSVKVGSNDQASEVHAMQKLGQATRELDVETMLKAKGAGHAVTEVYSRPRVVKMAMEMGLGEGCSLDLTAKAPDGTIWDFSRIADQRKCWQLVRKCRPFLVIGSPPCRLFSALQNLSRMKQGEERFQQRLRQAVMHVDFCVRLYKFQMAQGLYFLHEHLAGASSWRLPSVELMSRSPIVGSVVSHMCAFGMVSRDDQGQLGPVYKPTRFLSNSASILRRVDKQCPGCPEHVPLLAGRAAQAAIYLRKLCKCVCAGLKEQLELDYSNLVTIPVKDSKEKVDIDELWGIDSVDWKGDMKYWDDVSGKILDGKLVEEARMEDIKEAEAMGVWRNVPRTEAYANTGKAPIGTRWVDADTGDGGKPQVRSRLVAQESKRGSDFDMFVATPPIEYIKFVLQYLDTLVCRTHAGKWQHASLSHPANGCAHGNRACQICLGTVSPFADSPRSRWTLSS